MQAIVIKYFTDKLTRQKCLVGDTVELTKERFEELSAKGLVDKIDVLSETSNVKTKKGKK